jgi:CRP-like cAMP-binding protein
MTQSLDNEADLIRQVPFFDRVDPAMRKLLCFAAERRSYEQGEVLFSAGEDADAAYLVLTGELEVRVQTPAGALRISGAGANELVGELAILGETPRSATVAALTRVDVLRIPKDLLVSMVRESPAAALQITRLLARRLARATARLGLAA